MAVHRYEVTAIERSGHERHYRLATGEPIEEGELLSLGQERWLVESVEPGPGEAPVRAVARLARYRFLLRHPDGREQAGEYRRLDGDAPQLGHVFTTVLDEQEVNWQVVERRLALDERNEPFLECVAERDYRELEVDSKGELEVEHELEHRPALGGTEGVPETGPPPRPQASVELVALAAGEVPDWAAAARFIDALILEEIEDDLLETCGVDPDADSRERWLDVVKDRLRDDFGRFRRDVELEHRHIERWAFQGGRLLASSGSWADEADPDAPHGWMCRLVDSGALGAAGFERMRRADL